MRIRRLIGFLAVLLLSFADLGQPALADVVAPENGCCSVAPSGLLKPWRNGAGELTNGSYTVFGARQAKRTTGDLSDGASQFFYRVDDEAMTLEAAAYADQMGLWVDNKAKVYVDELIGVTGDGTPTHWINVYRRDPGGQVAPYVHGSPGNPP